MYFEAYTFVTAAVFYFATYFRRLNGDLGMSAVGTTCSPGLAHKIGPSLLVSLGNPDTKERSPHGISTLRNGFSSNKSRNSGK